MKLSAAPGRIVIVAYLSLFSLHLSAEDKPISALHQNLWLAQRACSVVDIRPPANTLDSRCSGLDALGTRAKEAIAGATSPAETIDRFNRLFFQSEKFQVTYDLSSSDHLLPGPVIAGRRGYCVGLAAVYLIVAEELKLPIHAVATPKHLFLRWDDGKFRRNIELFQEGRDVPDENYVREQRIPRESIERGVFLANLTGKEFLAFIHQNLGVLESQHGEFESSEKDYALAIHFNPKLAAAFYNRGNDELKQRRYRKAIRDYSKSLSLYPTDVWALWNRALAWKSLGEIAKAEADSERARRIDLNFRPPP